jgi:hypothetical protein
MKKICIHQPDFLPYLGFFHRLLEIDLFIILDDVQFERGGWHHRDKIKTKQGEQWLSISIKKGVFPQDINQVELADKSHIWIEKNLNLLIENYNKSQFFDFYFPEIQKIYLTGFQKMTDLNLAFLQFLLEAFDLQVDMVISSSLNTNGHSNQKLINLIKATEGTHYLSGIGARAYLNEEMFAQEKIIVEWQSFSHPIYPQLHGEFIPYLSCIDLLFNCGPKSKDILRLC